MKNNLHIKRIQTPIGEMISCASDSELLLLDFSDKSDIDTKIQSMANLLGCELQYSDNLLLNQLKLELKEYFNLERMNFEIPVKFVGTDFQKSVWEILKNIPYGETISYKKQSIFLKQEKAFRAVANANGKNNLAIIVPCHRVIGENGKLRGYAGGIWRKEFLLDLERNNS